MTIQLLLHKLVKPTKFVRLAEMQEPQRRQRQQRQQQQQHHHHHHNNYPSVFPHVTLAFSCSGQPLGRCAFHMFSMFFGKSEQKRTTTHSLWARQFYTMLLSRDQGVTPTSICANCFFTQTSFYTNYPLHKFTFSTN